MPWYHKRYGSYGKKNTRQVTSKWFRETRLAQLEHDGMKNAENMKKKSRFIEERALGRAAAIENKIHERQRKATDDARRQQAFDVASLNKHVCDIRVARLAQWGREDVERARAYQAELDRIDQENAETLRLERIANIK